MLNFTDDELKRLQSALAWKGLPDKQPPVDRRLHARIAREIMHRGKRRKDAERHPKIVVTQGVTNCARCGKNHTGVEFYKFLRKLQMDLTPLPTHWGVCPHTGEPILLAFVANPGLED